MENTQKIVTPADLERSAQDKTINDKLKKIKRKILVMSGKGGVGKSTVAGSIAFLLSRKGNRVGLLDVDLHGPSIPIIMNVKGGLDMAEAGVIKPHKYSDNLGIVSMGMLLGEQDAAVIWRGPLKISAIRQFISDIDWGELDYLIVDSPPGTGDEPLTVAQTIPEAEALIVTTPQEISLADVRKSINFCREVNLNIIGLIENMSEFVCPHCGERISIFGKGGGSEMASHMGISMLGEIPVDPQMVDRVEKKGLGAFFEECNSETCRAYEAVLEKL